MAKEKASLIDLVSAATEDDLSAIVAEIEAKEAQRAQFIAAIDGDIAGLKALHKVLDLKLHGKKPKKPKDQSLAAKQERAAAKTDMLNKIYDMVNREGSMPVPAIAARLDALPTVIGKAIAACDWFTKQNGEIQIAKKRG